MTRSGYEPYSEAEWNHIRARFVNSPLNEMELTALAQNAGRSWPFKGSGETPAKYVELELEALGSVPGLIGKQSRIRALMDILRETLAFDDPFGDMADFVESECLVDDSIERSIAKLNIVPVFPLSLGRFEPAPLMILEEMGLKTLRDLVQHGQSEEAFEKLDAGTRSFLTALSNKDEVMIARFLPYRAGGQGLHLAEAIGGLIHSMSPEAILILKKEAGLDLSPEESAAVARLSETEAASALKSSLDRLNQFNEWFADEAAELKQLVAHGGEPARFFLPLNNPDIERLAVQLANDYFGRPQQEQGGFLRRFLRR